MQTNDHDAEGENDVDSDADTLRYLEILPHGADHLAGDHVACLVGQDVHDKHAVAAQEALDEALPEALVVAARRRRERLHVLKELADERTPRAQEQQPLEPDEDAERAGHCHEQEPEPEKDLRAVAVAVCVCECRRAQAAQREQAS